MTPIRFADLRPRAANETWTQQIERIQRGALEKAVSVVNRMISSAEVGPNIRGVTSLPSASDDGEYTGDLTLGEHVNITIKAKSSVLQAVTVRAAPVLQWAVFTWRNELLITYSVPWEQGCFCVITIVLNRPERTQFCISLHACDVHFRIRFQVLAVLALAAIVALPNRL